MMEKRFLLFCFAILQCFVSKAQFSDPREKFSITASVDGSSNTDYRWETTDGRLLENGRLREGINARVRANAKLVGSRFFFLSVSPFYIYSNRTLRPDIDGPQLNMSVPNNHHHYGGNITGSCNFMLFNIPFTVMAIVSGNFSEYGYENFSGMGGAMFTLIRNKRTYLSLGLMCLVGTSVSWPLYPLIFYSHQFNDRWSIRCMETDNFLYYHATQQLKLSLGMELETDKIYLRPNMKGMPKKMEISELAERFGFFADLQATKELLFNFGLGVTVPFYNRLRESGQNKTYMRMYDHVKPFVKFQVKYSIFKKQNTKKK